MFFRKGVSNKFYNIRTHRKTLVLESVLIKLHGLRAAFLIEHLRWLLLNLASYLEGTYLP